MTVTIPIQLKIERYHLKDCLKAILHSILFHRTFSTIRPKESELLEVTFLRLDSPHIEGLINERISSIPEKLSKFQIKLNFYDKKNKNAWFPNPWETWVIQVEIVEQTSHSSSIKMKGKELNMSLLRITTVTDQVLIFNVAKRSYSSHSRLRSISFRNFSRAVTDVCVAVILDLKCTIKHHKRKQTYFIENHLVLAVSLYKPICQPILGHTITLTAFIKFLDNKTEQAIYPTVLEHTLKSDGKYQRHEMPNAQYVIYIKLFVYPSS